MHLSNGAIKEHIMSEHRSILSRDDIVSHTEVLQMQNIPSDYWFMKLCW